MAALAAIGGRGARRQVDRAHESFQSREPLVPDMQIVEAHGERSRIGDLYRSLQHTLDRVRKLLDAVMRLQRLEGLGRALQSLAQQRIGAIDGMPMEIFRYGPRVTRHKRNSLFCPRRNPRASRAPNSPVKTCSVCSSTPVV